MYLLQSLEKRKVTFGLFQMKSVDGIREKRIYFTQCFSASMI